MAVQGVTRDELADLHYITPIENLCSILDHGILSHNQVTKLKVAHVSVAMQEIQDRRARVVVPGARPLHDYVNLYFHARNPMLYLRASEHARLCVLKIEVAVIDLPGTVITDQNASSAYARFAPGPEGLSIVNRDLTFGEYWTHADVIEGYRRKSAKCAEVLVPDRIDPSSIVGVYASGPDGENSAAQALAESLCTIPMVVDGHLFFR